jgi:hypothetical protein
VARRKQLEFKGFKKIKDAFGGSLLNGNNPKTKRPLDSKLPVLLTLRGIKGGLRSPHAHSKVDRTVYKTAKKYGVKVYEYANVGNHIHVLIRVKKLILWPAFIRELTGRLASLMKTILNLKEKFWMYRPHTRIVRGWNKAYKTAKLYVKLNIWQAEGHIDRRETRTLKDLRAIFADG